MTAARLPLQRRAEAPPPHRVAPQVGANPQLLAQCLPHVPMVLCPLLLLYLVPRLVGGSHFTVRVGVR
jgi:hypothetical protein